MENSERIIVKFTSNFPRVFQNVQKFILFLNNLFAQESKGDFFIETVEDGILFIYKNIATFDLLNPQLTEAEINKLIKEKEAELQLSPEMLLEGVVSEDTFPDQGIDFQYNFYTKQKEYAYNKLLGFHQGLYGDRITLSFSEKYDLILSINNFKDFYLYVQLIALMANGIVH
ncbi:MAG: hypothetical protein ACTSWW_02020 [Promethearchaeota archaeon]